MAGRMSAFQRKADKVLRSEGWEFVRYTGSGHTAYRKYDQTTTVSSSPKNPTDALKQVKKYASRQQRDL